jgi:hypothetical protein
MHRGIRPKRVGNIYCKPALDFRPCQQPFKPGVNAAEINPGVISWLRRDGPGELDQWNEEMASGFDMGTLYTMVAGLLNILVVFDAYGGPLPPPTNAKRKNSEEDPPPTQTS